MRYKRETNKCREMTKLEIKQKKFQLYIKRFKSAQSVQKHLLERDLSRTERDVTLSGDHVTDADRHLYCINTPPVIIRLVRVIS